MGGQVVSLEGGGINAGNKKKSPKEGKKRFFQAFDVVDVRN